MEQKNNTPVTPAPGVPAMPKAPAAKPIQRRVGSVTLGVCLAVTGICFLCYHFVPGFDWQLVLKIAPAAGLILLGGEVLYFACRPEKWKYDFLSVLVCLLLMGGCFGLSMLSAVWEELDPACRRNELKLGQEYTSALYTRISEEAPEIPLQDLTGQVHLYSAAVDSLEDIHSGTGSVEVTLSYTVTLPRTRLRMGVSEQDVRLSNVFTTLCAFEDGEFRTDGYAKLGDPFVSECACWQVTLTAPGGFVAAGTGLAEAGEGVWRFKGENLRDFALFLSRDYHVAQQDAEGVTVRSFAFTQEGAQQALDIAVQALGVYEGLYGEYPYADYTVCAGQFCIGGMEYPGMALIDDALYHSGDGMLEFVIAHETAHQWWYAGVGSDQIRAPWQDEALAEYSTLLYYEAVYGAESFDSLYQSMVRPATESASLRGVGVGQSLDKFESAATYDALVYRKGAAMLHDLRVSLGNDAFLTAMRRYYRDNLYTIAQPEDFFAALGSQGAQRAAQWLSGELP